MVIWKVRNTLDGNLEGSKYAGRDYGKFEIRWTGIKKVRNTLDGNKEGLKYAGREYGRFSLRWTRMKKVRNTLDGNVKRFNLLYGRKVLGSSYST